MQLAAAVWIQSLPWKFPYAEGIAKTHTHTHCGLCTQVRKKNFQAWQGEEKDFIEIRDTAGTGGQLPDDQGEPKPSMWSCLFL